MKLIGSNRVKKHDKVRSTEACKSSRYLPDVTQNQMRLAIRYSQIKISKIIQLCEDITLTRENWQTFGEGVREGGFPHCQGLGKPPNDVTRMISRVALSSNSRKLRSK